MRVSLSPAHRLDLQTADAPAVPEITMADSSKALWPQVKVRRLRP